MSADDTNEELIRMRERIHDLNDVVQATVTKHATMALGVEHLVEGFREHRDDSKTFMRVTSEELRKITEQTTKTNGRVGTLEREMRDVKRDHRVEPHELKRLSDRNNAVTINIPINVRTITAILAAIVAIAMAGWKAGILG